MKFPYGVSDFQKLITQEYFYCDRTDRIPLVERTGDYLVFLRPRRFGKSLWLSTLETYYDLARKEEFQELFGHLLIGKEPTPLRNQYFILKWDFSCVDPSGSTEDIKKALHGHVNSCIEAFKLYYEDYLPREIAVDRDDALHSLKSLVSVVQKTEHSLYLLIDEYDNFANEVMMGVRRRKDIYEALVYEEGPLKTLFKAVKASSKKGGFERSFITGVSPVVMSDITSGYNIAENIYHNPTFNDLCGFHETEIEQPLKKVVSGCGLGEDEVIKALDLMRTYYNGYRFAIESKELIYNPTLAIYFMKAFQEFCKYPRKMLDTNLATDEAKLRYISQIPKGRQILLDLEEEDHYLIVPELADRFGIQQMLSDQSKDYTFMASFLYYFGVLTIEGETEQGKLILKVPNLVMHGLYMDRIRQMLLPEPDDRDDGVWAAEKLYQRGDMNPLCEFIEQRFFKVFHNRDYRWANELTVKTVFLALLYNDILYIMDSEKEAGRGYVDLTMIIRPDMRRFKIFDVLIEFKYVTLKDAGLTGEQARNLSQDALRKLSLMQTAMQEAQQQAQQYGSLLEKKYSTLRLRRYAVVSLGFERLWWEEVERV